jgi:predicted membrane protein
MRVVVEAELKVLLVWLVTIVFLAVSGVIFQSPESRGLVTPLNLSLVFMIVCLVSFPGTNTARR